MNIIGFVMSGILISGLVWFLQRHSWKVWIRGLCCLITLVALLAVVSFEVGPSTLGGGSTWYENSPYVEIVLFTLMVAGMVARYITKAIEARREKLLELQKQGGSFTKPGLEFDAWEFSYPLFVSVVTYGALLSQLKDHSLSAANATLSFQTGFFWQTLLATKQQGG